MEGTHPFHRRQGELLSLLIPCLSRQKDSNPEGKNHTGQHSRPRGEPEPRDHDSQISETPSQTLHTGTPGQVVPTAETTAGIPGGPPKGLWVGHCLPPLSSGSVLFSIYLLLSPRHRTRASGAPRFPTELVSKQGREKSAKLC